MAIEKSQRRLSGSHANQRHIPPAHLHKAPRLGALHSINPISPIGDARELGFQRVTGVSSTSHGAGGEPSTWFPPKGLVELTVVIFKTFLKILFFDPFFENIPTFAGEEFLKL